MPSQKKNTLRSEKEFLAAWDEEIEIEEKEERTLWRSAFEDMLERTRKSQLWRDAIGTKLLTAAGVGKDEIRKQVAADFADAQKQMAAQRKRAAQVLKKRTAAHAADLKKLLAAIKRTK